MAEPQVPADGAIGAEITDFGALDFALLPSFFISYSVLALIQLANLYGGSHLRFAGLTFGAFVAAQALGLIPSPGLCDGLNSAIVCGNAGRGLVAFGMIWVYVSAAMLAFYAAVHALKRILTGHY